MDEINLLVQSLGRHGERKDQRVRNISTVLKLLNEQLKNLQDEDKRLMREFQAIRKDINMLKEIESENNALERSYSLLTPRRVKGKERDQRYSVVFDVVVERSNDVPRRRAYSEKV